MTNRDIILRILTVAVFISSIFFIFMAYFIVDSKIDAVLGCFLGGCGLGATCFSLYWLMDGEKKWTNR